MDSHLGRRFQISPGSLFIVSLIAIALWLPFYDRILIPWVRQRTRIEGGITMLQRMGIGLVLSILAMVVSGVVKIKRRATVTAGGAPISVVWLFPQLTAMGFAEAFNILGQIEVYNKEFSENMISVGNSLTSVTWAVAGYLSTMLVNVVHNTTAVHGRPDWLTRDINAGRVDNYYFVIAVLGVVNLVYFVLVAKIGVVDLWVSSRDDRVKRRVNSARNSSSSLSIPVEAAGEEQRSYGNSAGK